MRRVTINALVDIGCLIMFITSLISELVLYLVLPESGGRGSGWTTYLGIARNQWVPMHNNTSLVFAALLILHLLLSWKFFWHINRILTGKEKDGKKKKFFPVQDPFHSSVSPTPTSRTGQYTASAIFAGREVQWQACRASRESPPRYAPVFSSRSGSGLMR